MIAETPINCPYCGESFITLVDYSAGSQRYIEDCRICCRPIEIAVEVDDSGEFAGVTVFRDDD